MNNLSEMYIMKGGFKNVPLKNFYSFIFEKYQSKQDLICELVKKFITDILAKKTDKITNSGIWSYIHSLSNADELNRYPTFLRASSSHASLSYYLAKNLVSMTESYGLEYFKSSDKSMVEYYFFDSEIEEFVGVLILMKSLLLPYNSYKVILSSTEKEYIGRGYGSKMYLTALDNVAYLMSDTGLYTDSLNIWVNYLPKKVNVWAILESGTYHKGDVVPISRNKFLDPSKVSSYIASKNYNKIPKILS